MILLNYWTLAVFVISVLYLAFVLWLSIGFGSNAHPPAGPYPYSTNSQISENETSGKDRIWSDTGMNGKNCSHGRIYYW